MGSFVRRVRTASGATAVQIVHKRGRIVLGIDHVGSAHDEAQLVALLEVARARLHAGQLALPLVPAAGTGRPVGEPVVEGTASLIVCQALEGVCLVFRELEALKPSSGLVDEPSTTKPTGPRRRWWNRAG